MRAGNPGPGRYPAGPHDDLDDAYVAESGMAVDALDEWSIRTPLKVYAHYGEHGLDLTYVEARRATDTIAGNLARFGVRRGDRVVVHCRSPYAATLWMFGIWKAGAVFCPVDPGLTGELLALQLRACDPVLVVTERAQLRTLDAIRPNLGGPLRLTVHDAVGPWTPHGHEEIPYAGFLARSVPPPGGASPDDPAVIMHTAGVTGRPKAVLQCHRWVAQYTNLLRRLTTAADIVHSDSPVHTLAGAFAGPVRAAWAGATVALWDRFEADTFWHRVGATGATTAVLPDQAVPWLVAAPERPDDARNTLRLVVLQPVPFAHADFSRRFGVDFVVAAHAQVESGMPLAAVIEEPPATAAPTGPHRGISRDAVRRACAELGVPVVPYTEVTRKGLLGAPLPQLEVAVLDERDRPCPDGVVGELALRPRQSNLVMREYLGDPVSTAEALRNVWLHTGDAVVREPGGLFRFVDRMSDRIRVRGENVSAYHIEDLVNQHPDIVVAAVFGMPGADGADDEIVLYAQPEPGRMIDAAALHAWCARSLPAYMRPQHVRVVALLPRTPNQRVEKSLLRRHFLGHHDRVWTAAPGQVVEQQAAEPAPRPELRHVPPRALPRPAPYQAPQPLPPGVGG